MAGLNVFVRDRQRRFIDQIDIRCKLLLFVCLNIASLNTGVTGLTILSCFITGIFFYQRIGLRSAFREIRFFLILLIFVFFTRSISLPGRVIYEFGWITISIEGVYNGALFCWRLLTVVFLAIVLMRTSSTMEIKSAIQWYLKPVPAVPEKRIAIMLSLMIRFLPMIIEEAKEVGDAQRSRGVESRKNPIYRISTFAIPLITRIFKSADELAYAMESRCFSENRTDPELHIQTHDLFALVIGIVLCCVIFLS